MCKFSAGDKVRLNSDGENATPMTINNYLKDETIYSEAVLFGLLGDAEMKSVKCVWRDDKNIPHKEYYHEDTLSLIE